MGPQATAFDEGPLVDWRFSFTHGIKIVSGEGCAANVPGELRTLDCERPLLVVDPEASAAGATTPVVDALSAAGYEYVRFDGVEPNPRAETVTRGVDVVEEHGLDGVVAVGGGSTIDAGKAISLFVTNDGPLESYEGVGTFDAAPLPVVAVPTTVGTGSAISQGMVLTDEDANRKRTMIDERVAADVALFDPTTLTSLPASVLASTGLDALAQAIESYISARANPVSETLARRAVEILADVLRPAVAGADLEDLSTLQTATIIQALAFTNSGLGLAHGMSNTVGGYYDTPHGVTTAVILPHVLEFNLIASPGKYVDLAEAMGRSTEGRATRAAAGELVVAVRQLVSDLDVPDRLRDLGVERESLEPMAGDAVDHVDSRANPRSYDRAQVLELFTQAF